MSTPPSRSNPAAGSLVRHFLEARQRIGGSFEFGVTGAQRNQDAIDVQSAIRFVQSRTDRGRGAHQVRVMRQGALGWVSAWDSGISLTKELARGQERRMIRQRLLRSSGGQHQHPRKLRGHLLQVFKTFLIFDNVRSGCVVYHDPSTLSNSIIPLPLGRYSEFVTE